MTRVGVKRSDFQVSGTISNSGQNVYENSIEPFRRDAE
jgi:hypothetical protein